MAAGCVAMLGAANQLQLPRIPHAIDPVLWPGRPGLVVGKLAYICEPVCHVLHHGTFVPARQIQGICLADGCSSPPSYLPTIWVTNARSRRNLHATRADGGRTDQSRRTRLRHFFAPAEGT